MKTIDKEIKSQLIKLKELKEIIYLINEKPNKFNEVN